MSLNVGITITLILFNLSLVGCGDDAPALINIQYQSSYECQMDLYPDYGPAEYYDFIDDKCGGINEQEGPEY